jgi:hypothetical protein
MPMHPPTGTVVVPDIVSGIEGEFSGELPRGHKQSLTWFYFSRLNKLKQLSEDYQLII